MNLPSWSIRPADYDVHHVATPADWEVSKAKAFSKRKAQYNPTQKSKNEWLLLEEFCIRTSLNPNVDDRSSVKVITDLHDSTLKQHKFCLDCRIYFNDPSFVAGYCSQEIAHFILVKWCKAGYFHGQPATYDFLKSHGANI